MVVWSALAHVTALGLVLFSPSASPRAAAPRVISVELVAPPSVAARASRAPAPKAPPKSEAPEPLPAPPEPPPPPKPKQIVLPEKPQTPKPKTETKPREREIFREPAQKKEKSLEELLAEMRGDAPDAPPAPTGSDEPVETAVAPTPGASGGSGDPLSAEERDWHSRVIRKMKGIWVVPPGLITAQISTEVTVRLDAAGNIVGTPSITRRSGNPWYDDGVVRALAKASPLPAPPDGAGEYPMVFEPGDSL